MKMLIAAITDLQMILMRLAAHSHNTTLASALACDAQLAPQHITFHGLAPRFLSLAMSQTLPDDADLQRGLGHAASLIVTLQDSERQGCVPPGPATEAYLAMLNGIITGGEMTEIALEAFERLDLTYATSFEDAIGEHISGESIAFPTPIGEFSIDKVRNDYSGTHRFELYFTPPRDKGPTRHASAETRAGARAWIQSWITHFTSLQKDIA